jgi:hypothetical protein
MGILLDPIQRIPSHPSEELLEEYVFHRLPEAAAAQIEEHLLLCPRCQDSVGDTDRFVSALRLAAKQPPEIKTAGWGWRKALEALPGLATNRGVVVPVFALAILAVLVVRRQVQAPLAPVTVSLSSVRGLGPLASAPPGRPLFLSIEAPDLTPGSGYHVELVDASGGLIWKGAATASDGKLTVDVPEALSAGVYWVRLYGAHSDLLREFGLSAK